LAMQTSLGKALTYVRGAVSDVVSQNESNYSKMGKEDLNITSVSVASGIFPHNELIDNGMLFLTAGPNSTGTAIEWGIYELGRRPEMQKRLRAEILSACPKDFDDFDDVGSRLASLAYLNAICSEIIRCYPFVPLSPKVTEKDTTLLGARLPKGTALAVPVEALNRDPALWGPDADEFNPDRWMGAENALTGGATNNFAMLSFGAGPNICIGQSQARAFLACVLAAVVQRFEITLANAETAGLLRAAPFKKSEEGPMLKLKLVEV
jgi:cytochrome P450